MERENSAYRRLRDRLPLEMQKLQTLIGKSVHIQDYRAGSDYWRVQFEIQKKSFQLIYDRGALAIVSIHGESEAEINPERLKTINDSLEDLAADLRHALDKIPVSEETDR